MPAKNSIKQYLENGYYHIYNRGVEKRKIFLDKQDYNVFLSYLKEYLLPKDINSLNKRLSDPQILSRERDKILKTLRMNNFHGEIDMIAFCLMSNHFHFFVKQKSLNSIDKFMNSLCTRYTMYFNKKYKRVGKLYQGTYKALIINNEYQFVYLSKYIHKQAISKLQGVALEAQISSFGEFIGERKTAWLRPEEVLSYFSKSNPELSYKDFVLSEFTEGEVVILNPISLEK
jgi:putative transposase